MNGNGMWISMTSTIALWERKESVHLSGKREDRIREGEEEREKEIGKVAWLKKERKKEEKENS